MNATTPTGTGSTTPAAPRRTRVPDQFTNAMVVVTMVFGVWAVALVVLTTIGILKPAFYYSDQKSAIKALGATVVAVLCVTQLWSMETAMGHLPRGKVKMRTLMRTHRFGGRIAIVLAALIAFFCMVDIGAPKQPLRVLIHIVFGASGFAALGIKLALIRFRPEIAYNAAPWLGRYIAFAFIVVWISSGLAYFTGNL
jgi:hypothetical protein